MSDNTNKSTVADALEALKAQTGLTVTMKQVKVVFPKVRRGDALPLNMNVEEFIDALAENGEIDLSAWLASRPAKVEDVPPAAPPVAPTQGDGTVSEGGEQKAEGSPDAAEPSDNADDAEPPAEGGVTADPATTNEPLVDDLSMVDGAIGGLHEVASFASMREPVAAGQLVTDWDLPLETVFALAGFDKPGTPFTLVDAAVVREAYEQRQKYVAPSEPTGQTVDRFNARMAHVAPSGRVRGTSADRPIKRRLFNTVKAILASGPHRPFEDVEEVRDGAGNVVAYKVPSLINPSRKMRVEPMQYKAIESDPTAGFWAMTEADVYELVGEFSELSIIPKACQNCGQDDAFHLRLESKFWALLEGLEKRDDNNNVWYLRFYLPGMKKEWKSMFKSIGLPTDDDVFQELKFRKVHDECGIIAHEVRVLVGSPEFQGVDWFDPEVRARFVEALGAALRPRMQEIKEKTRNQVDAKKIRQRTAGVIGIVFEELDKLRANREAGRARVAKEAISA